MLRGMLLALKGLMDSAVICQAFASEYGELTWFDLELLAAVETELKPEEMPDGEGR